MNMKLAKVLSKLLLLLRSNILKILVPEDDNATLGEQQSEFIFLCVRQCRQLEATNLDSNAGSQVGDDDVWIAGLVEIGLGLVGVKTAVMERKGFRRWVFRLIVVNGKISGVFILGLLLA
jgi:hypothetical protein